MSSILSLRMVVLAPVPRLTEDWSERDAGELNVDADDFDDNVVTVDAGDALAVEDGTRLARLGVPPKPAEETSFADFFRECAVELLVG